MVARAVWAALLAAAGAVATLAGLVYFVGAVSLWIALRNRGYSADVAIEHQPRSQLIGVGLRGAIALVGIAGAVLLGGLCVSRIPGVRAVAKGATIRGAGIAACVLLVLASFVSWRWVAIAIVVSTLLIQNAVQMRFPGRWRLRHWLTLIASATITAIAWVAGGHVRVPAVLVSPVSSTPIREIYTSEETCDGASTSYAELDGKRVPVYERNGCERPGALRESTIRRRLQDGCSVIYFGETDSLVYLGAITNVRQTATGRCRFDAGPLVELRREEVRLSFLSQKGNLNPSRRRPIAGVWDEVTSFFDGVDGRLLPSTAN